MKIAVILTSHDELGTTGKKTGFWLEEFAAPYYVFKDAGAELTLASPLGGQREFGPSTPKATSPARRPPPPSASKKTPKPSRPWPTP